MSINGLRGAGSSHHALLAIFILKTLTLPSFVLLFFEMLSCRNFPVFSGGWKNSTNRDFLRREKDAELFYASEREKSKQNSGLIRNVGYVTFFL